MLLWRCSCWAVSEKRRWWLLMASLLAVSRGKGPDGIGTGGSAAARPERRAEREFGGRPGGRWGV